MINCHPHGSHQQIIWLVGTPDDENIFSHKIALKIPSLGTRFFLESSTSGGFPVIGDFKRFSNEKMMIRHPGLSEIHSAMTARPSRPENKSLPRRKHSILSHISF